MTLILMLVPACDFDPTERASVCTIAALFLRAGLETRLRFAQEFLSPLKTG